MTTTSSIVLDRTNETVTVSDIPLQKSSCPDSGMMVDDKVSHLQNRSVTSDMPLQKSSCPDSNMIIDDKVSHHQNRLVTADLEVKILGDVIEELIDESIKDMRGELVVKLQPRSTLERH